MNSALEKEILGLEDRLTTATREIDLSALDTMYADDILFTGVTGATCDKASLMDEARRGKSQRDAAGDTQAFVASYDKEDLHLTGHGDTAVTSYRFIITIRNGAQSTQRRFRTTNVWRKRGAAWQVIAGHTSSIENMPA